jgi:hypothetical protein
MPTATYTTTTPKKADGSPLTYSWTNDPLGADDMPLKKEHADQLRTVLIDAHLHKHTAGPRVYPASSVNSGQENPNIVIAFTDPVIIAEATKIRVAHLNELIGFIKDFEGVGTGGHRHNFPAFSNEGVTAEWSTYYTQALPFVVDPVVVDSTLESASAWQQLRTFLQHLTLHTHSVTCNCECTCTCTCTGTCGCTCECTCTCDCATCG